MNIVLDTNTWLDCLVFKDKYAQFILDAVNEKQLKIYTCTHMFNEFKRVLNYIQLQPYLAKLALNLDVDHNYANDTQIIIQQLCDAFLNYSIFLDMPEQNNFTHIPKCKDQDDQIFLNFCVKHCIPILVSKDKHLLKMHKNMRKFSVYITNFKGIDNINSLYDLL